jgi:hypothetical protein
MIFLSHNWKDKTIIERFDQALVKVFGRENVFYDSWNIQPGDGIIGKMEDGLQSCKYFLFFVSTNSLASPMVKLEWQNALMRSAKNDGIKFIPIRVDRSDMPVLLTQTAWIDLYSHGLDVAVRQAIDVCSGKNIYEPSSETFSNLHALISGEGSVCNIEIVAEHFMEPISSFAFFFTNSPEDVHFDIPGEPAYKGGSLTGVKLPNGSVANVKTMALDKPTTPGHPFKVQVQIKNNANLQIVDIRHERKRDDWVQVKVTDLNPSATPPAFFGTAS